MIGYTFDSSIRRKIMAIGDGLLKAKQHDDQLSN